MVAKTIRRFRQNPLVNYATRESRARSVNFLTLLRHFERRGRLLAYANSGDVHYEKP